MAAVREIKRVKVPANKIQMGMYVTGLDRPWKDSPFLLQGFVVSSSKVLAKLKELCEYIYIDTDKSVNLKTLKKPNLAPVGMPNARNSHATEKDPYRPCLLYTSPSPRDA